MPLTFVEGTAPATPDSGKVVVYAKTDGNVYIKDDTGTEKQVTTSSASTVYTSTCQGRLTLTTGTPVTTSDVTAAGTLYFTPYKGGQIALYTSSVWTIYTFTERSLSLSGLTTTQPYDIFAYDSSGTVTLEAVAWSSATARATALTTQNGVYVKSGATDRRYLGTVRMQATGQCEDSVTRRFVWNYYNRVHRELLVTESANSWSYTTASWTTFNSSTANRVEFVIGVSEEPVYLLLLYVTSGGTGYGGICLDNTNANDARLKSWSTGSAFAVSVYHQLVAIGYHYLQLTQYGGSGVSFYGDNGTPTLVQTGGDGWIAA